VATNPLGWLEKNKQMWATWGVCQVIVNKN